MGWSICQSIQYIHGHLRWRNYFSIQKINFQRLELFVKSKETTPFRDQNQGGFLPL